jgi:hypothetical protein
MHRIGLFSLVALLGIPFAQDAGVAKADFARFTGVLDCGQAAGGECPGAADGFVIQGLAGGEAIPDPAAPELATGGRVVVGFQDGKPFLWPRYSVEFPNSGWKWVVLNEVSSNDQNRVFLSLWRHTGSSLDLVKVFPRSFPLDLGEMTVHASSPLPDGSRLLILKGEGADAGIRIQDYRLLRLTAPDRMQEILRRTNRSEIPVESIMERLNADQPVDAVLDSTLTCALVRPGAASKNPKVRFTLSRQSVLYTKEGPRESPQGSSHEEIDVWRAVQAARPSR